MVASRISILKTRNTVKDADLVCICYMGKVDVQSPISSQEMTKQCGMMADPAMIASAYLELY